MKILILGGFLGSGKTSVLIPMARYLVTKSTKSDQKIKVAIIENEIGEIGIDDQFIRNDGYNVQNLFGGCACCSLAGELIESVATIQKDLNPEWIVLEATGVAYPKGIADEVGSLFGIESTIVTIVDAKRWSRIIRALEHVIVGQLENATSVLVNKIDLVADPDVQGVIESIRLYNSDAKIFPISAVKGINNQIFNEIFKE